METKTPTAPLVLVDPNSYNVPSHFGPLIPLHVDDAGTSSCNIPARLLDVYEVAKQKIELDAVAEIAKYQVALNKKQSDFDLLARVHQTEIDRLKRGILNENDAAASKREKLVTRLFELDGRIEEAFRSTPPGAEFCIMFVINGSGVWGSAPSIERIRVFFPGAVELLTKVRNLLHMHQLSTTLDIEPGVREICTDPVEKYFEWRGGTHLVLRCNLPEVPPTSPSQS